MLTVSPNIHGLQEMLHIQILLLRSAVESEAVVVRFLYHDISTVKNLSFLVSLYSLYCTPQLFHLPCHAKQGIRSTIWLGHDCPSSASTLQYIHLSRRLQDASSNAYPPPYAASTQSFRRYILGVCITKLLDLPHVGNRNDLSAVATPPF